MILFADGEGPDQTALIPPEDTFAHGAARFYIWRDQAQLSLSDSSEIQGQLIAELT